jgi:hypothetical protein
MLFLIAARDRVNKYYAYAVGPFSTGESRQQMSEAI